MRKFLLAFAAASIAASPAMPLPILSTHPQPSASDLVRLYHRCDLHWARQVAEEETVLDVGTALTNRELREQYSRQIIQPTYALAEGFFRQWVAEGTVRPVDPALLADVDTPLAEIAAEAQRPTTAA